MTPAFFTTFNLTGSLSLWCWRSGDRNLTWLLVQDNEHAVAIDLPDGPGLLALIENRGIRLTDVLFTHAHGDHVVGAAKVLHQTGCRAWGDPAAGYAFPVTPLADGDRITLAGMRLQVLETSGHSSHDLSYVFPEAGICFCGDTVFDGGCGRMFAGPAERYWASICRIRELPDETWLCMGHDYAEDNFAFAASILPEATLTIPDPPGRPGSAVYRFPVTVGMQKQQNLFLRADETHVASSVGRAGAPPAAVFQELRERKNQF